MIGPRLKLAREAAGLSLRDLESAVNRLVSAQAIGKYERNEMMPGSSVLLALAAALRVSPEYLLSTREIELVGVEFRKETNAGAKEEKTVHAQVIDHVERYLRLEELLHLPSATWHAPKGKGFEVASVQDAERAANELRSHWKLGLDPIPNLVEFLEEKSIKVIARELPPPVFGSKAWVRRKDLDDVAVILVNNAHIGERQRLTLAHELAHLVMKVDAKVTEIEEEKCATRFAGAFLVPDRTLVEKVGQHRRSLTLGELVELKRYFMVSLQVLVVRCAQLEIISRAEYRRAWDMLKAHRFLEAPWPEPAPIEPEVPRRLERLCYRAVAEGALSESKAAELLQIPVRVLDRRLQDGPVD